MKFRTCLKTMRLTPRYMHFLFQHLTVIQHYNSCSSCNQSSDFFFSISNESFKRQKKKQHPNNRTFQMKIKTPGYIQSSKLKRSVIDSCEKQIKCVHSIVVENKISHNQLNWTPTLEVVKQRKKSTHYLSGNSSFP